MAYKLTAATTPGSQYLAGLAGEHALRITWPVDGSTHTGNFDVHGTAEPGATVELWIRPPGRPSEQAGGENPVSVVADEDGKFVFNGGQYLVPNRYELFVKVGDVQSPRITVLAAAPVV